MQYHLITVVWGSEFIEDYLKVVLPLQICSGNLGAFRQETALYRIFVPPEGRKQICESPVYQRLKNMIPVDFVDFFPEDGIQHIVLMNRAHQMAIQDALKIGAILIFLSPDCLISHNSFKKLIQFVQEGKRVVMIPGLRVNKKEMVCMLEQRVHQEGGIPSRELVQLAIPFLHEISHSLFWNLRINTNPSAIYWKLDDGNVLIRAFHLHPFLVWPEKNIGISSTTIDNGFEKLACPDPSKWKIVEDSDDIAVFDITTKDRFQGMLGDMPATYWKIAKWAVRGSLPQHRCYFKKKLYFKTTDRKSSWLQTEQESDFIVNKTLRLLYWGRVLGLDKAYKWSCALRSRLQSILRCF